MGNIKNCHTNIQFLGLLNIKKGQVKLIHHQASEEVYDDTGLIDDGNEKEDEGDIPEEYNSVAKEREKAKKLK